MSNTYLAPEFEYYNRRYRWRVADCYRLAAPGFLTEKYKVIDVTATAVSHSDCDPACTRHR